MTQPYDLLGLLAVSGLIASAALAAHLVVWLPPRHLRAWLPWLHATAGGLLIGDALFHMLPETLSHALSVTQVTVRVAIGIVGLLTVECIVRGLPAASTTATFARMDIAGDALHHFVDGIVIGASFAIDHTLGLVVALAILAHELPREMGNAGVLVAGGYVPRRAFALSMATTAALPLGAISIVLVGHSPIFLGTSLAVAAGTTVYLACGDVLPGMWPSIDRAHRFTPALGVAAGMVFMWWAALIDHGH